MPVIRINAEADHPVLHGGHRAVHPTLTSALKNTGPILIMVHGYKFLPNDPQHCPHTHIFSMNTGLECPKALSWPHHLGFGQGNSQEGLAIAFGWSARGSLWTAQETSNAAALALARLVRLIRQEAPQQPVHVIAHSMGAHLVLSAMAHLEAGDLGRVLLLNGATYQSHARSALNTKAGNTCELFNIVSHENAVYDFLFERLIPASERLDRALGRGLVADNALTIPLDKGFALDTLADQGFEIARKKHWYCHWSTYLRPGVFTLYQTLLRTPERLPLPHLQHLLTEAENTAPAAGWTTAFPALLPSTQKQAS